MNNKFPNNIIDSYPLSPMQQAMLFHYQLAPESGVYVQQLVCTFKEELDIELLKNAWSRVLSRHELLRTAFRWEGLEEPLQDVYDHVEIQAEIEDWQELSEKSQKEQFEAFLMSDKKRGLNMAESPMMRLSFFRLDKASYKAVWTYHHSIIDGRSRRVVIAEVLTVYDALRKGESYELPETKPYREYISWLREQDTSESKVFWENRLKDYNPSTFFSPLQTVNYLDETQRITAEITTDISESVADSLRTIAKENRVTLNIIIQGAWSLMLSRYSSETDVVIGEVRAGRRWTNQARNNMVGLFINTLPVRIKVHQDMKVRDWLKEIREVQFSVRNHETSPLIDIQKWSGIPNNKSLFDNVYVYYDMDTFFWSNESDWNNRDFYLLEDNGFPLTLDVYADKNIGLKITFDRNQFDVDYIERMLGHLKTLLVGISQNTNRTLTEIPMLTDEERQKVLIDWNDTKADYPQDKLIHQIFEAQVEKTPDAVALEFEGEQLTYQELNERANQLAHHLKSIGVGPETMVGIAVERSFEMVIGLYGILKAGGAYLPLDPTYPAERLAYMIKDAEVPVLLTQAKLLDMFSPDNMKVICLDMDWPVIESGQNSENPECEAILDNLAYTIYTSGSTGNPKGVMNTHRGILNRLLWMQDAYKLTDADCVLQKTPFSFDVSVWEFFWPLMFGVRLVIARPEGRRDSEYLVKTIIERQVTIIHFVPSMLQVFLMARDIEKCDSLRQVICSGEVLSVDLQELFFSRSNAKLHNLYGPTEAAVDVTYWECQTGTQLATVPIGRPVANTQIYILDGYLKPVPTGISGELYIGGVQVARGYLNLPELTEAAFVPDPFGDEPEARLYKTGDSARYLSDGNIEFLGRLDFQVKIRGNRIELGEIEVALRSNPKVRDAIVLVREDIPEDKRLVAYVILKDDLSPGEMREYIMRNLPDYMIPDHFITLTEFPLTRNQKIDRKSLPAPDKSERTFKTSVVPPSNKSQIMIADAWKEILNINSVGIDDNFFEIGGHSLLLVRVFYKLQERISGELTIMDMFRYPTIRTLSEYLNGFSGDNAIVSVGSVNSRAQGRRAAILRRRQIRLDGR